MKNKPYFLALNRIYGIGPLTIAKLLKRWPLLEEMFTSSSYELENAGLPTRLANAIASFDLKIVERDCAWQTSVNNRYLLTWEDVEYPALLREIQAPPAVLYAQGDLSAFNMRCISIVGTRKPTPIGIEMAAHFARGLSQHGIGIVSGLALGVDAHAHRACLDVQGKTIAVMGTGIDTIYPVRHGILAEEISQNGLILSEFPLGTQAVAGHFPRRNRIISGLSLGTLVVEAAVRSGSLITARMAVEQNREVFAIPGSIRNPQTRGCHYLLQQGAKLVTSVQDVLDELTLGYRHLEERAVASQKTPLVSADSKLLQYIGFEVTTIEMIMQRSGLDILSVTSQLANLEIQGVVKAITGGYMRCT